MRARNHSAPKESPTEQVGSPKVGATTDELPAPAEQTEAPTGIEVSLTTPEGTAAMRLLPECGAA
ncbi:MAG: hypothetical protein ACKV19_05110, partial [Verrucomicrobiales bacterium]